MTLEQWLAISVRFVAVVSAVQLLCSVIGTNVYELQKNRREREFARHPHARRLRASPLISVVVLAQSDETVIIRCLQSLMRSTYRNFEVIVVDNGSRGDIGRIVTAFKTEHPNRRITLFTKRAITSRFAAVRAGYRKSGKSDIIAVLDADHTVDKKALTAAVRHFNTDPKLQILTPKLRTDSAYSGLGVLQKYRELVGYRLQKWDSAFGSGYAKERTIIFRRSALSAIADSKRYAAKPRFADDVLVYADAPATLDAFASEVFSAAALRVQSLIAGRHTKLRLNSGHDLFFGWLRLPLAICSGLAALQLPFLLGYIGYVAVGLHEPTFLLSTAGLASLLIIFAIWDDQQAGLKQKLAYTLGTPLTYGPIVGLIVVQAVAIVSASLTPAKRSA